MNTIPEGTSPWDLDHVYLWVTILAVAARALLIQIEPADFWFHMAVGRDTALAGAVPTHDSYSYTMSGAPYHNGAWLAGLAFYGAYTVGGLPATVLLNALAMLAAVVMLVATARRMGALTRVTALAVVFALALSASNLSVRPQTLAFPLFAAVLTIQWGARMRAVDGREPVTPALVASPLIVVLWTNIHGSFPLAIGISVLFLLVALLDGARDGWTPGRRRYAVALAAVVASSVLATLVNPRGHHVYSYVFDLISHPTLRIAITEWGPPRLGTYTGVAFFAGLVLLAAVLARARPRPEPVEVALLLVFAALGASALRNVVWLALVGALLLARGLRGRLPDRGRADPGYLPVNIALLFMLVVLNVVLLPGVRSAEILGARAPVLTPRNPVPAVAALRALERRPSRVFNELGYGSYMTWALEPRSVFIDTRIELYPPELLRQYARASAGRDVDEIFAKHDVDGVLASKSTQPALIEVLRKTAAWTVVYEDGESVLFVPSS